MPAVGGEQRQSGRRASPESPRVIQAQFNPAAAVVEKAAEIMIDELIGEFFDSNVDIREQLFQRPIDVERLGKAHTGLGEEAAKRENAVAAFKEKTTILDIPHQQMARDAVALRSAQDDIVSVLASARQELLRNLDSDPGGVPDPSPGFRSFTEELKILEEVLRKIADERPGLVLILGLGSGSTIVRVDLQRIIDFSYRVVSSPRGSEDTGRDRVSDE